MLQRRVCVIKIRLRCKKEDTLVASVQSLFGSCSGGELHDPSPCRPTAVIDDHNGPFDHAKLGERLLQELVGNERRQILHRQGCSVCSQANTKRPAFHRIVVHLSFSYVGQRPGLLEDIKQEKNILEKPAPRFTRQPVQSCGSPLTSLMNPKPFPLLTKTSEGCPYLAKSFLNSSSVMSLGRLPTNKRHRCVYDFSPGFNNMDKAALNVCQT